VPRAARFKTWLPTPCGHPARLLGCRGVHVVFFEHKADGGGSASAVAIMLPEAQDYLDVALAQAHALAARVVIACETRAQADAAARHAAPRLPHHRRISLERFKAAKWGVLDA
jgi:hypothetical protein